MIIKGIGATTHVDRHNCKLEKSVLEDIINQINEASFAPGVGIEHDSTIMPIGKVIKGELVQLADGEFGVEITQELFEKYSTIIDKNGNKWYVTESKIDRRPFADTEIQKNSSIRIAIDPVNFREEDYENLLRFYEKNNIENEALIRKSVIPDPEIIIYLVTGALSILTTKKAIQKLSDAISDDVVHLYEKLKVVILDTAKYIKQENRPITYIIKENDTYVKELAIITEKPETVLLAISNEKLEGLDKKIKEVEIFFGDSIAKMQCLYNNQTESWDINYFSMVDGKVVGCEKCYKKTMELTERVSGNLSIGLKTESENIVRTE